MYYILMDLWIILSLATNNYLSRLVLVLAGWSFQGTDTLLNWRSPTKGFQSSIHHSQMCISLRKGEKTLSLMYRDINVSYNYGSKFSVKVKLQVALASFKQNKAEATSNTFCRLSVSCISNQKQIMLRSIPTHNIS